MAPQRKRKRRGCRRRSIREHEQAPHQRASRAQASPAQSYQVSTARISPPRVSSPRVVSPRVAPPFVVSLYDPFVRAPSVSLSDRYSWPQSTPSLSSRSSSSSRAVSPEPPSSRASSSSHAFSSQSAASRAASLRGDAPSTPLSEASTTAKAAEPLLRIELRDGSSVVQSAPPGVAKPTAVYEAAGRWLVEAMVVGEGEAGSGGARGMRGVPYASAQGTAPMEAFHAVEWDVRIFEGVGEGELTLQTYPLLGSRAAEQSQPWPPCVLPARRRAASRQLREEEVARHVLEFLRRNRGVVVRVSGIGAREGVAWRSSSRQHLPGQPRCNSGTHDCVEAAVINAAFACRGLVAAEALEQVLKKESRILHNFRELGVLFQRAHETVTGCRVVRDEEVQKAIQGGERIAPFRVLAARRTGVFIVPVLEEKRVDHAVVVDAYNGVIIDSEERTAFLLSVDNLARCGGDGAKKLRVVEVREIRGRKGK